jgi:hypothetical protein
VELAGIESENLSLNSFRHTYASVRLQILDNKAPVTIFTVAGELGHQGFGQLGSRYGHLLKRPKRSEVVEYKDENGQGDEV